MGSGVTFALVTLTIATSGGLLALAQFWSLPTAYLTGVSAAGGIALINSIGNLAGFASPSIVGAIKQSTGSTDIGVLIMAGVIIVGSVLTMLIPAHLVEDGRKRPDAVPAKHGTIYAVRSIGWPHRIYQVHVLLIRTSECGGLAVQIEEGQDRVGRSPPKATFRGDPILLYEWVRCRHAPASALDAVGQM